MATSNDPKLPSNDIRRRLLAGEPMTSATVAREYGVSKSLLGTVIGAMIREGMTFAKDVQPGPYRTYAYTVTDPAPPPGVEWGKGRGVRKLGNRGRRNDLAHGAEPKPAKAVAKSTPAPAVRATVNGKHNGTQHPVPQLGESVQVFLLALTEDGRVNVGLRDGEQTWLATVDGFSAG